MAFQGRGSRRKSYGTGRILGRNQDFLSAGNIFHGSYEGMLIYYPMLTYANPQRR